MKNYFNLKVNLRNATLKKSCAAAKKAAAFHFYPKFYFFKLIPFYKLLCSKPSKFTFTLTPPPSSQKKKMHMLKQKVKLNPLNYSLATTGLNQLVAC